MFSVLSEPETKLSYRSIWMSRPSSGLVWQDEVTVSENGVILVFSLLGQRSLLTFKQWRPLSWRCKMEWIESEAALQESRRVGLLGQGPCNGPTPSTGGTRSPVRACRSHPLILISLLNWQQILGLYLPVSSSLTPLDSFFSVEVYVEFVKHRLTFMSCSNAVKLLN